MLPGAVGCLVAFTLSSQPRQCLPPLLPICFPAIWLQLFGRQTALGPVHRLLQHHKGWQHRHARQFLWPGAPAPFESGLFITFYIVYLPSDCRASRACPEGTALRPSYRMETGDLCPYMAQDAGAMEPPWRPLPDACTHCSSGGPGGRTCLLSHREQGKAWDFAAGPPLCLRPPGHPAFASGGWTSCLHLAELRAA